MCPFLKLAVSTAHSSILLWVLKLKQQLLVCCLQKFFHLCHYSLPFLVLLSRRVFNRRVEAIRGVVWACVACQIARTPAADSHVTC